MVHLGGPIAENVCERCGNKFATKWKKQKICHECGSHLKGRLYA